MSTLKYIIQKGKGINFMKLDCVLTAVNTNPLYVDFIPLFTKTWKKLYPSVDVKIILIADSIPEKFEEYKDNIILFPPLKGISTSFTSQYIRLLYPAILNYDNGILITDMDMLPMNSKYFSENFKKYTNNKFINIGDLDIYNQYYMCYNIASSKTWSDIFNIKSIQDIKDRIIKVFNENTYLEGHGNIGWSLDQEHLHQYVTKWTNKTNNFIQLEPKNTEIKHHRLPRNNNTLKLNDTIEKDIKDHKYSDHHICRPFNKFEKQNNRIYDLL